MDNRWTAPEKADASHLQRTSSVECAFRDAKIPNIKNIFLRQKVATTKKEERSP